MKIEFYQHSLSLEETESISQALEGLFLTAGPLTRQFETRFADTLHCRRVVGTYSCTTALFLCLKALGIGRGDEVITTPMSFIATANSILEAGARPVFVDVEETTGNIDAELIEPAITERTKAIMPVHLYGHMCDMRRIGAIANRHGLHVIEDAAHCIEGERDGVRPGELSDAACFSFYATKNMTAGEGGAIATNHEQLADRLLLMRSHGMNKEAAARYTDTYRHWDMVCMGYKGNMFDIQAALLLPQLDKLDVNLKRRREIAQRYENVFGELAGVGFPAVLPHTKHARHLFTIWVRDGKRDAALVQLQENGVGVAVNYRPIHLLTYYRRKFAYQEGLFPVAERIGEQTLSLPLYPKLTDAEVERVCQSVQRTVAN